MAQNRRTISKIEFNKRIRDLVSRDSNRLRQTFQKFDKECASRLAELQSMQEKVRHSMRNLAKDKMQAQLNTEQDLQLPRKESETERGKPSPREHVHHQGSVPDRKAFTPEEKRRSSNKASLPGISHNRADHLEVPRSGQARSRRHSLPHRLTFLPGSPKENRTLPRASMTSSLPKEAFVKPGPPMKTSPLSELSSSPKETSLGIPLQYRKNGYRLSIGDLPISSSRSDHMSNVRLKRSPQLDCRSHTLNSNANCNIDDQGVCSEHAKDEKSQQACSNKDCKAQRRSNHTPGHLNTAMETEPRRGSDPNNVKSKRLVKRTRSSSLPVEPETLLKDFKPKESHSGVFRSVKSPSYVAGDKHESPAVAQLSILPKKKDEAASSAFEELRHCRYLRSSDTEA